LEPVVHAPAHEAAGDRAGVALVALAPKRICARIEDDAMGMRGACRDCSAQRYTLPIKYANFGHLMYNVTLLQSRARA
jgi:hypothetical protein